MKIIERDLRSENVLICPIGDVQYGNFACSTKYVKRYLDWTQDVSFKLGAERIFVGTGDYMDLMSPSNRGRYKASGLYGSTLRSIDTRTVIPIMQETHQLLESHLSGNTVAMVQGHHWMFLEDGYEGFYHTDKWLSMMLGAEFVEAAAIIKFNFPSGRVYRFHVCHGEGNGSTETYGINKLSRQSRSWEGIDAFAMGHTHKAGVGALIRVYEEDGDLLARQVPLITCGGFLKSYVVDDVNYPEAKQLWSLALSATALHLQNKGSGPSGLLQAPMMLL
jgi:hypothetical protein